MIQINKQVGNCILYKAANMIQSAVCVTGRRLRYRTKSFKID